MSAIDLRYLSACSHAEPLGHMDDTGQSLDEPVECLACGWRGVLGDLLHCGDPDGDCTTNLWTPCCRAVEWCFS
jgi:hypothetical protein